MGRSGQRILQADLGQILQIDFHAGILQPLGDGLCQLFRIAVRGHIGHKGAV